MKERIFNQLIAPENFIMHEDRLLTAIEAKAIAKHGHTIKWIKCKRCSELGATNDDREFCSSYCKDNYITKLSNTEIGANEIKENKYAQKDDLVMYERKQMKVFLTDCTPERLSRKYRKVFTYILIFEGKALLVKNLDSPLIKVEVQIKK